MLQPRATAISTRTTETTRRTATTHDAFHTLRLVAGEPTAYSTRRLVESPPVLANGGVENGARGGRGPRSAQRTCRE
jgi:hypothetical protein